MFLEIRDNIYQKYFFTLVNSYLVACTSKSLNKPTHLVVF